MTYNTLGQLERVITTNNGAYRRFWYGAEFTASYATVNNATDEAYSVQVEDGVGQVIGSVSNHPGSAGGYSLVNNVYDLNGRTWLQSNPTEVNSAWVTTGDDAAGIYYTQQTYDWKGRPLVTTNPDGTTKIASYSGCGCAGGEVVTLTDEGTIDGGVAKRRQQKIYSDVLGRTVKTELLNWQNGSPYSTVVNSYNVRDQTTLVRQYAGVEGSSTFQDTEFGYDGYGRLKTRHLPEQAAGANTIWDYNADDTLQKITDARGATSTFGYNNRHLATSIAYAAPSPIPATATTSYTYDAVGNRTFMSDASGTTTYQYNELSQLTSETKSFTGLPNPYTLAYEYTLSGSLKSLTDHANRKVTYTYDEANRQKSIIGTNYSITQFVNNVFYRAWNVPREVTFGNTRKLTMAHNQRLSVTHMEMELQGSLPPAIDKDYEYNNDNRLKYSGDNIDPRYDRAFNYDQSRRLNKALSGAEARGSSTTDDRPYNQFANYDAFDHRTVLNSRHWSKTFPYITSDSFLNNRRTGWQYDANGNILNDLHRTFTYDAASRLVASSGGSVTQVFDGDGRRVKTTDQFGTTYYLSSSVLSEVVAELDNAGNRSLGFIYALGDVLAEESANGFISFVHKDASRLSVRKTHPTLGVLMEATELDPQGADVELEDPYLNEPDYDGRAEGAPLYPGYANVTSAGTCTVGGIWMPCDMAYRMFPQQVGTRDWGVFRFGIDPLDPFGPFGPIDWHPGFLRWLEENNRVLTSRNYLELDREWFSNLLAEQKSIDWSVLHSSLKTCIHALWPMFEMTSFKPTSSPPKKLGKNHDQYNGVIGLTDLEFGTTFNVTNDPTPSAVVKALLISRGARGLTDSGNPFWTYSHPAAGPTPRPGELRYPELFGQISMDYIRVQIHETGAALSVIRDAYHPGPWAGRLPDGGLDPTHDDDGPSLEDCVGREYYKQLKLTPHKYP